MIAQEIAVWLIVGAAALYAASRLGLVPLRLPRRRRKAPPRIDVPVERLTRGKRRPPRQEAPAPRADTPAR